MFPFALTIFTGAFLLFLVQPLIAKFILPWFGGSPAVWTTCMLVFQLLLLCGYAYAHGSIRWLKGRRQLAVHLVLLGLALATLPITPGPQWQPPDGSMPVGRILLLLTVCVGLPYFTLSATGPLFQAWFGRLMPSVSPYRLYALSNVGSLLALLSYPFLVEPHLTRHDQAVVWSIGYGLYALCAVWAITQVWRHATFQSQAGTEHAGETVSIADSPADAGISGAPEAEAMTSDSPGASSEPVSQSFKDATRDATETFGQRLLWFMWPACAVVLLLAVTNKICQDIAVIPFLWVLPLSLYLLSFIISFDSPRWYFRPVWLSLLAGSAFTAFMVLVSDSLPIPSEAWLAWWAWLVNQANVGMRGEIVAYLVFLFVACMVCHGEVYRLRPPARRLTGFYLAISAGGAAGGLFVALGAPLLFQDYFELHTGMLLLVFLVVAMAVSDPVSPLHQGRRWWALLPLVAVPVLAGIGLGHDAGYQLRNSEVVMRNFYGVLKVKEYDADSPSEHRRLLQHGGTTHGLQFQSKEKRLIPTTYYVPKSGIGIAMEVKSAPSRHVGIVGLGTGTIAAWGRTGDRFRFYEINDQVLDIAKNQFTYIKESPAKVDVVMGDARLALEREQPQGFDILALDAFSSDAIPVHLLTREAVEHYLRHLKSDGLLVVHVSNRYLDLKPIVQRIAEHFKLHMAIIDDTSHDGGGDDESREMEAYNSDWIILTRDGSVMDDPKVAAAKRAPGVYEDEIKLWTDERSDLWRILMF